jgi:GNAT superfamily N-acetyltransferase
MVKFVRTNSDNPDFVYLVKALDEVLAERDGEDHSFYDQFNKLDQIKWVVLAYDGDQAVSCGAIKEYEKGIAEVKRMFTSSELRGRGIASLVLNELEEWAAELTFERCILETGMNQPEAIRLYEKNGYTRIANYGQYAEVEDSRCFEKRLEAKVS